jgi:quercetin dioxygenase-like cupin family protein
MPISERIISGQVAPLAAFLPHVALRMFASAECGSTAMSTGTATFAPGERLLCHTHDVSEAATVLEGQALFSVEGRIYLLSPLDCIHVPAGVAHEPVNASKEASLVMLSAFASPTPARDLVTNRFQRIGRLHEDPSDRDPEHIVRFGTTESYELSEGTEFYDLFAGRYGSVGICGGYGRFRPGSSLPCHIHDFDESITIVEGTATCEVAGQRYSLTSCDTAFVPAGRPHRFLNKSDGPMAMIWVYAGSEPSRILVDVRYCAGSLPVIPPLITIE